MVLTETDELTPLGEGWEQRGLWHGMVYLVDPNTKVHLDLVWHEGFEEKQEAEDAVLEHMETDCPRNWGSGTIAYAPNCPVCGLN